MFESCLICTEFSDGLERLAQFVPSLAKGGLKKIVFFKYDLVSRKARCDAIHTDTKSNMQLMIYAFIHTSHAFK